MELPTRTFEVLYHVGSLDPADKGAVSQSLEGDGLSVSLHPEEWARIARLGDSPTWALTKPGNRLVDYWAISAEQRAAVMAWAEASGLAVAAKLWSLSYRYGEDDEPAVSLYESEAEARDEHGFLLEEDASSALSCVDGWLATDALRARVRHSCSPGIVEDFAVVAYAVDVAGADGVWWADRYDPAELSCPRGVLAPARLSSFRIELATE